MYQSIDCYCSDPGSQAAFYSGHKIAVLICSVLVWTPPFKKIKFWLPPPWVGWGGIWKIKKRGGSVVQGQVFLKGRCWHFSYLFFSRFIIFTFRNYFTLCKIVLCIWRSFFSVTIILWKKVILSCLKMNLKISHKLR